MAAVLLMHDPEVKWKMILSIGSFGNCVDAMHRLLASRVRYICKP